MAKENLNNAFFDNHLHLYNLSHAGFLAYINRLFLDKSITFHDLIRGRFLKILGSAMSSENIIENILKKTCFIIILAGLYLSGLYLGNALLTFISENIFFIPSFLVTLLDYLFGLSFFIVSFFNIPKLILFKQMKKIINTLSILENDTGSMLLYMELDYYLLFVEKDLDDKSNKSIRKINYNNIKDRLKKGEITVQEAREEYISLIQSYLKENKKKLHYNGKYINKVILTPLMMDFNSKGYDGTEEIYYNLPPHKPIVEQVIDVFNGIKN